MKKIVICNINVNDFTATFQWISWVLLQSFEFTFTLSNLRVVIRPKTEIEIESLSQHDDLENEKKKI